MYCSYLLPWWRTHFWWRIWTPSISFWLNLWIYSYPQTLIWLVETTLLVFWWRHLGLKFWSKSASVLDVKWFWVTLWRQFLLCSRIWRTSTWDLRRLLKLQVVLRCHHRRKRFQVIRAACLRIFIPTLQWARNPSSLELLSATQLLSMQM